MSSQTAAGVSVCVERRRSTRLPLRLALIVFGEAVPLQENACTSSVNNHGALVALAAKVIVGQRLILQNPENWAERGARVTRIGCCCEDRTEVGIEFTEPAPDFWGIGSSTKRYPQVSQPQLLSGEHGTRD